MVTSKERSHSSSGEAALFAGLPSVFARESCLGPTFRQRTNGSWDDRAAFRARIIQLRDVVEHTTITVLDELIDADSYAERHVVDLVKRDPDGRFTRIEEATAMLEQ